MTIEATRLEELKKVLSKNGFDYMVQTQDGGLVQVNIWLGESNGIRS